LYVIVREGIYVCVCVCVKERQKQLIYSMSELGALCDFKLEISYM